MHHSKVSSKNTTVDACSVRFHNLEVARVEAGELRLSVLPYDRACHTRINQFLKSRGLPVVLDVKADHRTAYLRHRETKRDVATAIFPEGKSADATVQISKRLSALNTSTQKAA